MLILGLKGLTDTCRMDTWCGSCPCLFDGQLDPVWTVPILERVACTQKLPISKRFEIAIMLQILFLLIL